MMYQRLVKSLESFSYFLFGARGTGKSTWLKQLLKDQTDLWLDFLDSQTEADYARDPSLLSKQLREIKQAKGCVVIDEVQKVPAILDVVHKEIENKKFRFVLSGSSARKLKRGSANLLGGRAFERYLFPLSFLELGEDFNLTKVLSFGSLPSTSSYSDDICKEYLLSYVNTYLREEIQLEQLVRKIQPFRNFLELAGQSSGTLLNYSKLARDIGSDPSLIKNYFQILEDTLLGFYVQPFSTSIRKRMSKTPKFYLFDVGVIRAIERKLHLQVSPQTYDYGRYFEHLVIQEVFRLNQYTQSQWSLTYFKTKDDREIDLVLERPGDPLHLIEIKSTSFVTQDHVRAIEAVHKDLPKAKAWVFSLERLPKRQGSVSCVHWQEGIRNLFNF